MVTQSTLRKKYNNNHKIINRDTGNKNSSKSKEYKWLNIYLKCIKTVKNKLLVILKLLVFFNLFLIFLFSFNIFSISALVV